MNKDKIESDLARIAELREWIANAVFIDLSASEVVEFQAEADQLEDELDDWNQWVADVGSPDATGQNQWREDEMIDNDYGYHDQWEF
jgi:hypothetical protein